MCVGDSVTALVNADAARVALDDLVIDFGRLLQADSANKDARGRGGQMAGGGDGGERSRGFRDLPKSGGWKIVKKKSSRTI